MKGKMLLLFVALMGSLYITAARGQTQGQPESQNSSLPESSVKAIDKSSPIRSKIQQDNVSKTTSEKVGQTAASGTTATNSADTHADNANGTGASPAPSQTSPRPNSSGVIELKAVSPASDNVNYMSDRVTFQFDMLLKKIDLTTSPREVTDVCAPAGTRLRGVGEAIVAGNTTTSPIFRVSKTAPASGVPGTAGRCAGKPLVSEGDIVLIAPADMKMMPPDRVGISYGTLLVPYKYHFSGSDFGSGASVGGYLGYRWDRSGVLGIALQPVVFLGAATIPVSEVSNGQVKTENMAGVSYGLGVLGTVKDSFHLGLITGADRTNKSANYRYNGKVWLAISLGFEFSN